jgi:hypothetical protein
MIGGEISKDNEYRAMREDSLMEKLQSGQTQKGN